MRHPLRLVTAILFFFPLFSQSSFAAPGKSPPPKESTANDAIVLSDDWYTIILRSGIQDRPYGYYNDRVELKKGRLFFQNHVWKKEENYINEEQLGAFAENSPDLTPLFFNFHSTYRSSEISVDGTVVDGKLLTVRAKKSGTELPIIKKNLSSKTFLSVFFPYWLKQHLAKLQPGKTIPFRTVLEDNLDQGFNTVHGNVRMEKPDSFAEKTGTMKLLVDYRGLRSFWWLDSQGTCIRMEMPQQKMVIQRVSKAEAQGFLTSSSTSDDEE